ncbi:hypothetical protein PHYBLDRAFT_153339 [Phycomyces blakesleeanus NRRL 1555(-)]|uniref:Tc1-like transposase DDE domain-containing protein n=1 Tax=Phycomyces blakesleeanus (strain ATCC 8743b / DSM 1359 / FGSC 10004 / NBRC 33097 / NRRL 1555) TaxID=763407 RepID=A0A167JBG3_PHYB8|nr:hypothetical protein PHYBLDRAFT_153337 [Phycomyces blakesleeanus NRRL 1555(-)]XP_018283688.1 hypothetical protein PHYBLDRAFT_153339 [Phycomyces blakesleeanus NRRL 1555(-)]OAD65646.1 hypothetical protein PHYBLDRAFT_153337 [Phycomyces blakesleeanus NRRL 1555(-)]OAD65648.1 hypothetical protein PHYBLDRAFT_153339 [Phycomyces blakesleeanus NRRL 1555(-)]|eukprot:XP_018283686.1 hypothetical protein PHYBLDRAFT_153337 [Phycomyces blakesleeanus NRRL 1555(-)]
MSTYFFYENGQGKIYDEQGNDAMEWSEEVDPFYLKTLTTLREYQQAQPSEQEQMRGELDENMNEVSLRVNEEDNNLFKAAKAARFSGVSERTGQQWAKRIRDEPEWNIFEKQTNKNKRKTGQLQEEHKEFIIDLFNKNPQTCVEDVVVSLERLFANFSLKETSVQRSSGKTLQKRFEWVEQWTTTDMDFLSNCVFVDESGFDINMRPPSAWSKVGTPAIVETKSTKGDSHSILGAISSIGVVDIELRVTEKPKQRKVDGVGQQRKQTSNQKRREGAKTGHYLKFIGKTLDEMDKNSCMSNFYIVMDNAPIHASKTIDELIASRGYRCIHLPRYSAKLNLIEQFWFVVKNKVKRGVFTDEKDLTTRIADACNDVPIKYLKAFIQHSCNQFNKCKNKEPL